MKNPIRSLVLVAVVATAAIAAAAPAPVAAESGDGGGGAVFVQTNNPAGNSIDVYHRGGDGALSFADSYATGGLGARATGAGSDPLASQGSLQLIPGEQLLIGVNAGSNSVSAFRVRGDRLRLLQTISSDGPFPVGLAVHDDLVYVLDGGGAGYVSGYRIEDSRLEPIPRLDPQPWPCQPGGAVLPRFARPGGVHS